MAEEVLISQDSSNALAFIRSNVSWWGQSFTIPTLPSGKDSLNRFEVYVRSNASTTDLTVKIWSGNNPDTGSLIETFTLEYEDVGSTAAYHSFTLTTPIDLTESDEYTITLETSDSNQNWQSYYDNTSPYAGGTRLLSTNNGTSWATDSFNIRFKVWVKEKTYELSCDTGEFTLTGNATGLNLMYYLLLEVGSFSLTGIDIILNFLYVLVCSVGNFVTTGLDIVFRLTGWVNRTKPTTSYTERTKPTTSYSDRTKPTTNWTKRIKL